MKPTAQVTVAKAKPELSSQNSRLLQPQIFRPVQYLGSKLRTLESIAEAVEVVAPRRSRTIDMFSGTSVVSQMLAVLGHEVVSCDSQQSCHVMASAMLGVSRTPNDLLSNNLIAEISDKTEEEDFFEDWRALVQLEDAAIEEQNADALHALNAQFPLVWRVGQKNRYVEIIRELGTVSVLRKAPLFASLLAGTYFGMRQALSIDSIRLRIEQAHSRNRISTWQYSACLTALMSAMSKAVFSAGKHFAQPLTSGKSKSAFRSNRLLQDRSISIVREFAAAAHAIDRLAQTGDRKHSAICAPVKDMYAGLKDYQPDVVYADPPYTAQQYSRFYHALDTLIAYRAPHLNHQGRVTTGLYPSDRFRSEFSSKRAAPAAFHELLTSIYKVRATLILSYSDSQYRSNGNARMISRAALLEMCRSVFGPSKVEQLQLNHAYRQFNAISLSNKDRNDSEFLILCRC
ncbi:MAG: adenine-specific DNA-methyltransferase [Bradyrhizobium sp.]|jgi:adenine-specific DNA methylase|nr:adenine-specific DNA-methyltransferase [Bradyrhizobium sp.]